MFHHVSIIFHHVSSFFHHFSSFFIIFPSFFIIFHHFSSCSIIFHHFSSFSIIFIFHHDRTLELSGKHWSSYHFHHQATGRVTWEPPPLREAPLEWWVFFGVFYFFTDVLMWVWNYIDVVIYIYMWLSNNNGYYMVNIWLIYGYYMVNIWLMMINNNLQDGAP